MGLFMSSMKNGINLVSDKVYEEFAPEGIKNFEDFQKVILDIFNTLNETLPGTHYVVPRQREIKELYDAWSNIDVEEQKKKIADFMSMKLNLGKIDTITTLTGMVTPPAAMMLKRTGENLPQINKIKYIPDVVFVPSATIIAVLSVKLSRQIFNLRRIA